ncbi:MAG: helix-turn-helix transcriptional regulator, partial [Bacteroidota bacterium]|nr:helix-turn-helix transcriptional regulator [Bacteroidota bacterium]MDX5429677.1 helix-turn-helix transcriptional regulator [Bacteroidota bacterium]MDX5468455.1 helix-turn-helix transcriptional regulator [Bacteroidota bacterium]
DILMMSEVKRSLVIGERQLQRSFKQNLGLSPKTYYRLMRLYKAHGKGMTNKYRLSDLALNLGYTDAAHFNKDFKSYFGISPSHYFSEMNLHVHSVV